MDGFDTWENGHQAKSITVEIKLSTIKARPKGDTRSHKPSLKAGIVKTTFGIKNRFTIVVTGIEAASQRVNDGVSVLLNEVPNVHVDWDALCLDAGNGLGAVLRPEDHTIGIDAGKPVGTTNLSAQQFSRFLDVFLAIIKDGVSTIVAPAAFTDVFGYLCFIDVFPTLDVIGAAGITQSFALFHTLYVRLVG